MFSRVMHARVTLLCCLAMVLLAAAGCGTSPVVSAMTKVGLGHMDTLTGTEIQALIEQFAPGTGLTEDQAADLAEFMAEYEIKTIADFQPILKVVSGQMDTLAGPDILAMGDRFAPQADLTAQQADAIVEFLVDNQVKTMQDLQALVDQANADPNSVQLPEGFEALFEGFDPSTLPDSFPV